MQVIKRRTKDGGMEYYSFGFSKSAGGRISTGIFTYTYPENQIQKNHNKEALRLLETKKSELILERLSAGSSFIPGHKFKANFFEYYEEYVKLNRRAGNRHLSGSLQQFRNFFKKEFIAPIDINENLCKRFRQYLLDRYNGDTPANYYARFKWVIKAATKDGYYRYNPAEDIKTKSNPSKIIKANLEVDEYLKLLDTPCLNEDVKDGFIFSCYTGLLYVDANELKWVDIKGEILFTRIVQTKTGKPITLTLHPIAKTILEKRKLKSTKRNLKGKVFNLPSNNGSNEILKTWMEYAEIKKHITWSCVRLSFSILLQDKNVDMATVAYLMGHITTKQVLQTYKRHRPKDQSTSIGNLPSPENNPYFLILNN
ncbi:MAG TPA: site-specific integrase [Chitinophagaceae bacterium]|nr:site-specific integrase [Chitinophagaceae bacterium]